ncbi:MAG: sulfatase-like hydrolase/transferase, partial [Candidatus Sumerlaeota bacterium]|nr:sulfatase-like hydrolase/transferase [Candidatus Sumerlaeota bacterium]
MPNISRRDFVIGSALAGASALSSSLIPPLAGAAPKRKNVLFIAVDDLKPDLGCYGFKEVISPNIDRLAKSGMLFNRCYCQQAVCSPTRSSLLTGCRPDTTKVYDLVTHFRTHIPDVVTLPQLFKQNGYHTQGLSKIYHNGYDDAPSWSVPHEERPPSPQPLAPNLRQYYSKEGMDAIRKIEQQAAEKNEKVDWKKLRGLPWEAPEVDDAQLLDGATALRACELLAQFKKESKTFFLAVGFIKPHLPFIAPKKYWDLYDPAKIKLPEYITAPKDAPEFAGTNWGELRAYFGIPGKGPLSEDQARKMIHGYRAATSFMDAQVGKVLDALDKQGLRDDTIVILWGDHGWHLGDHGWWCKHTNYEQAARVPLMISVPGMRNAGAKSDALVEFVDIYPTLAELCGLPLPSHLEGTSFAPVLDDPKRPWKKGAISQYPRQVPGQGRSMGYSLRTDRYRYTEWNVAGKNFRAAELYDYEKDPEERVNLANHPDQAGRVKELAEL